MSIRPDQPQSTQAHADAAAASTLEQDLCDAAQALIQSRQNVSPKRLQEPGPSAEQLAQILDAAAAAPDHGLLRPWRFVIVPVQKRSLLADVFAQALIERDAAATPSIRLAVETMPSFAPNTAARSQPMRSVRCNSRWVVRRMFDSAYNDEMNSDGPGRGRNGLRLLTLPIFTKQTGCSPSVNPNSVRICDERIACPLVRPEPKPIACAASSMF